MTNQRTRTEKALHRCAEAGVPETVDLWPEIREYVSAAPQRSARRLRFLPRTRVGWIFATLAMILFGTGAYAASGLVYDVFRSSLPGTEGDLYGVKLDQKQTHDDAAVTLEWAYADTSYIVVGFGIEDRKESRQIAGRPAELAPIVAVEEPGFKQPVARRFPERIRLADESDNEFRVVDGGGELSVEPDGVAENPLAQTVVFMAPKNFDADSSHRFRFEVPLEETALYSPDLDSNSEAPSKILDETFAFDFEVPVASVPVTEVNQKDTSNGLTITLDRVERSLGAPQAIFCFDNPDNEHLWAPVVEKSAPDFNRTIEIRPTNNSCWAATLPDQAGSHSLIVPQLDGTPLEDPVDSYEDVKKIRGPWKFTFEVPER